MKRKMSDAAMNMTPMIDVVFQLIIFFITAIDMQNRDMDLQLKLAMAPHGRPVTEKDPRTIYVDVDKKGNISIGRNRMTPEYLYVVLRKAVGEFGQRFPVVIRGDMTATHEEIRKVMDMCSKAGLYTVKFAAIQEPAGAAGGP